MNILFFNDNFFYYDKAIKRQFELMGHSVNSFVYRTPVRFYEVYFSGIIKKKPEILALERSQRTILSRLKKSTNSFDAVLVTSGQDLLPKTLASLRDLYNNAKFVWFLWDNICNIDNFETLKGYYDEIVSFDSEEAISNGFTPLNDFYVVDDDNTEFEKTYDLSYVGTYNERRANIITDIMKIFPYKKVSITLFEYKAKGVRAIINRYLGKIKKQSPWSTYDKMKYSDYIELVKESKCILDISYENQTGLSMRIYEALAYNTKIITTNKSVLTKDFYNPNNVFCINPDDIRLPDRMFFDTPYKNIDVEIVNRYSIVNWCKNMERIMVRQ